MRDNWKFDIAEKAYNENKVDWDALIKIFPILINMESIKQSSNYHKEGNVLNHTKMVIDKLISNSEWRSLCSRDRSVLFLSALFHDVGKIDRTTEDIIGLTSKGHSSSGARIIRRILWDFEGGFKVPFDVREYVASMALLHMLPVYLLEKEDPLFSIYASSMTICNRDLSILAEVDINGRICDDISQSLSAVSLFGDFCIENNCYLSGKQFQSDHTRFMYFFNKTGHPDLNRYHDCKGKVHMISGLPGAGKDTYIKNNLSLPVVGLDDLREEMDVKVMENEGQVSQLAKERCREYMRKGHDFVFNATNLLKQTRGRWIRLFNQYNYNIEIHYIEPSFSVLTKQNSNREKKVPEDVVYNMFKKIEPPTLLECHVLNIIA